MRTKVIELPPSFSKNVDSGKINGYLISFWKDWEKFLNVPPKQIYFNCCYKGEIKGPHLHINRWDHFICIRGKIRFVVKYGENDYEEIDTSPDLKTGKGFKIVVIPPAVSCALQNIGDEEAFFINMPNPAWHPDNQDDHPVKFENYKWRWS